MDVILLVVPVLVLLAIGLLVALLAPLPTTQRRQRPPASAPWHERVDTSALPPPPPCASTVKSRRRSYERVDTSALPPPTQSALPSPQIGMDWRDTHGLYEWVGDSKTGDDAFADYVRQKNADVAGTKADEKAASSTVQAGGDDVQTVPPRFTVSYSHPRQLAKGVSKPHLVTLYLPSFRAEVDGIMHKKFGAEPLAESFAEQDVEQDKRVVVELSSPAIKFDPPVTLQLTDPINVADFGGIPDEACTPGMHTVRVRVQDAQTAVQYVSHMVYVEVVDYAFGKVSRPTFQKVMSIVSGAAAVVMWALALLEQIDKTWGFTGGTAAAAVAAFGLYQLAQLSRNTTTRFP